MKAIFVLVYSLISSEPRDICSIFVKYLYFSKSIPFSYAWNALAGLKSSLKHGTLSKCVENVHGPSQKLQKFQHSTETFHKAQNTPNSVCSLSLNSDTLIHNRLEYLNCLDYLSDHFHATPYINGSM
jgi:hypothetical protein